MNDSNLLETVSDFFKPQSLNTAKKDLYFVGQNAKIRYERMYSDYYISMFNAFKHKIPLNFTDSKIIGQSGWEPLLKAGHDSFVITLAAFIPHMKSQTEMSKMMGFFEILKLHGLGIFELGLAPRGAIMQITVANSLEDQAFDSMEEKPGIPVCAYTAGIILACYNLSMASDEITGLDMAVIEKIYRQSPDIIQAQYGFINGFDSQFTLHIK